MDFRTSFHPAIQFGDAAGFLWSRVDLAVPNLPEGLEGLKILHLADVHIRTRWMPSHDRLLREIGVEKPDLILMTGDLIEYRQWVSRSGPHVHRLASGLVAPLGCYTILGNHDGRRLGQYLAGTGVQLIDGDWRRLKHHGETIELIGLPGYAPESLTAGILAGYPPKHAGALRIVLSHYPDHVKKVGDVGGEIFLAGHTHGGQVCLPGGVPIIRHSRLPRRLCSGVHRVGDAWLVVSRGFGFAGRLKLRLFCPAEVGLLTLRRA